jgi:hypothetical protein
VQKPKSPRVLNLRRKSDHKSFGERSPFNLKVEVDEIHPRKSRPFLVVRYRKVEWVLTPEVFRTSHIHRFLCVLCKGGNVPEVSRTREYLDRPIVRTCVHRSRVVHKSGNSEELK